MTDINLENYKYVSERFEELATVPDSKNMENKLMKIARNLRKLIRKAAPRGKKDSGNIDDPNSRIGNLRRSIQAKKFKRKIKKQPQVYVRVNWRIAPHAHLVEYGTEFFRMPIKKKVLHFYHRGFEIFAKWAAPMPALPFFRPTIDKNKSRLEYQIEKEAADIIYRTFEK